MALVMPSQPSVSYAPLARYPLYTLWSTVCALFLGSVSFDRIRTHLLAEMSPLAGGLLRGERIASTPLEIESAVSLMRNRFPRRTSSYISPFRAMYGVRLSRMHRSASLSASCVCQDRAATRVSGSLRETAPLAHMPPSYEGAMFTIDHHGLASTPHLCIGAFAPVVDEVPPSFHLAHPSRKGLLLRPFLVRPRVAPRMVKDGRRFAALRGRDLILCLPELPQGEVSERGI
jgi:hypothetical protein